MHLPKKITVTEIVTSIHSFISLSRVAKQEERLSSFLLGSGNHSPSIYLLALGIHSPPSSNMWLLCPDPESVWTLSGYAFTLPLLHVLHAVWPTHRRPSHEDHRCFSTLLVVALASPVHCLCQMVSSQLTVLRTAPSTLTAMAHWSPAFFY